MQEIFERIKNLICYNIHKPEVGMCFNQSESCLAKIRVCDVARILNEVREEYENKYVSLGVYKQVAWERDIAIEQLHELGYGFGEKIDEEDKNNRNNGWIPVETKLPDPYEKVQVTFVSVTTKENTTSNNFAFVNRYDTWFWEDGNIVSVPIVAWRENLKQPYQPK